jgi:signal transduction histidine kinase/ActR/RegA family two-component response regulator
MMMKQKLRKLSGMGMVIVAVILFGMSILYVRQMRESLWDSLTSNALELTKNGANGLSAMLESETVSLQNVSSFLQQHASTDEEEIQNTISSCVRDAAIEIEIFDLEHCVGYTTVNSGTQPIYDKQLREIAAYEESGWIKPFYSSYDGKRYIGYYERFQFTDGVEGVIRKDIDVNSLGEQYSLTFYQKQGYSYVVDLDGEIIVRPQDRYSNRTFSNVFDVIRAGSNSQEALETMQEAVLDGKSGILYCDFDGTPYVIAFSAIEGTDSWSLLSLIPEKAFTAHLDSIMQISYGILLALILILVIMLIYVFYRNRLRQKEKDNLILAEVAQKAEDANLAKSNFLSHMSHDIRTPINGIVGMTGIALKNIDNSQRVQDCLMKIEDASHHLLSLINDVLDMSRIESGKIELTPTSFDLYACLCDCVAVIEGQIVTRDLTLVKAFDPFPNPVVIGDQLHLRQILINILGNAVKFTPDGKHIYFQAECMEKDGKSVFRFVIEDEGIGMAPEFLPHLFEPFSQENGGTRTTYKGTGIGMAITKRLVDLMGGTIDVSSTLNVGTKFTLEIPMEIDTKAKKQPTEKMEHFHLQGMKILLVEDNELNMEIAKEILECEGMVVTCAENGQVALDLYAQSEAGTFDAILMDLMMPVMDGLTATMEIRALDRADAKTIPILAMTANAFEEDRQKTKAAGMNAHLSKPIKVDLLYATLAKFYTGAGSL